MCHKEGFPRYDDVEHIDVTAVVPPDRKKYGWPPRVDPREPDYTEAYCEPPKQQ